MNIPFNTAMTGMLNAQARLADTAQSIAREGAGGNLAEQMVEIRKAETEHAANAAVVKTASEMTDRLLDILA
jgi:flagellar hook protein FlgE